MLVCLPLAAPMGLSPLYIPTLCGAGGGVWDLEKFCAPKMARPEFPKCRFRFFFPTAVTLVWGGGWHKALVVAPPTNTSGSGGGGGGPGEGGDQPPPSCGARPF